MFVLVKNDLILAGRSAFDVWKGMVMDLSFIGSIFEGTKYAKGVGDFFGTLGENTIFNTSISPLQIAAHGIWGGTRNVVMGGKCKDGFMSAAVAKLAGQIGLIDYLGGEKVEMEIQ